jgi:hypothetical protein
MVDQKSPPAWEYLARGCLLFLGIFAFLFGQVFSAAFSFSDTAAGVSGVVAGVVGPTKRGPIARFLLLTSCAFGIFGALANVYSYYSQPRFPGDYYPWFMTGPYLLSFLTLGYSALARLLRK